MRSSSLLYPQFSLRHFSLQSQSLHFLFQMTISPVLKLLTLLSTNNELLPTSIRLMTSLWKRQVGTHSNRYHYWLQQVDIQLFNIILESSICSLFSGNTCVLCLFHRQRNSLCCSYTFFNNSDRISIRFLQYFGMLRIYKILNVYTQKRTLFFISSDVLFHTYCKY